MTEVQFFALLDFSKPFFVDCDTSRVSIGAMLLQEQHIAFLSQALREKQLLLSTYKKEIPALIIVLKWQPYSLW